MNLKIEPYADQVKRWPKSGKYILAQYDEQSVVVYQAYRPEIGLFAAEHGYFGGAFSMTRMTWIKPNFLWMMYRSGWGTKPGQEITLAIRLKREFFERILSQAVASSFGQSPLSDTSEWKQSVQTSNVRLQWDPDHDPHGNKEERRAIQLGLRNEIVQEYAKDAIIEIEDISNFVSEQRELINHPDELMTPIEDVFEPNAEGIAENLGLTPYKKWPAGWISAESYFDRPDSNPDAILEELYRELPPGHVLQGKKLYLVGVNEDHYDDFVFEVKGADFRFAAVHLTWNNETDPTWPSTGTFATWEDFCLTAQE